MSSDDEPVHLGDLVIFDDLAAGMSSDFPISMFTSGRHFIPMLIEPSQLSHTTEVDISCSLPTPSHLKIEKHTGEKCTCSLCLDDIEANSDVYKLTCNHIFHAHNCMQDKNIMNWIEEHKTCPYCRAKISVPKIIEEDEILTVMNQSSVSREDAINALQNHDNIVDAILSFC